MSKKHKDTEKFHDPIQEKLAPVMATIPKTYILDTNVLMGDPDALSKFEDNLIVLPDVVIEELDNHKKDPGDRGYNVRQACRNLEKLLHQSGSFADGIQLENGGMIIVVPAVFDHMPDGWEKGKPDNGILMTAWQIQNTYPDHIVILVTNDISMRVKASQLGIVSEVYKHERIEEDFLNYTGRAKLEISSVSFQNFLKNGKVSKDVIQKAAEKAGVKVCENMFLILTDKAKGGTKLARVKNGEAVELIFENSNPYGVTPRNSSQRFCIEALMLPAEEVPLVILTGPAGTAKTFLTLACGLEQTMEKRQYRWITVTRANVEFDRDIGALPGTEEEKVGPLARGCIDNLELLVDGAAVKKKKDQEDRVGEKVRYLFDTGVIRTEAMGFLRGRSVTGQILFVDEAQNTTPAQMKGILTRAGDGTKIVIAGDLDQIDNPRLDRHANGLSYALKLMSGDPLACVIGMSEAESTRSALAKRVAEKDSGYGKAQ